MTWWWTVLVDKSVWNLERIYPLLVINVTALDVRCADIFVSCNDPYHANKLLRSFNKVNPYTKFTMEREENDTFYFLDLDIPRREDRTCQRYIHRKETWSGQTSFSPIVYKYESVKTLNQRARKLSWPKEHTIIRNDLQENVYPLSTINIVINTEIKRKNAKLKRMFDSTVIQKLSNEWN